MSALALMAWAAADTTSDPTNTIIDRAIPFLNLGIIAFLLLAFVRNWGVVPKWTYDTLKREHEQELERLALAHQRELDLKDVQLDVLAQDKAELKATNDQLTKVAQDQFLPALIEANRLTGLYVDTLARRSGAGHE